MSANETNHENTTSVTVATPSRKLGGITGKGFMPGNVANPNGRPAGFANYIRKQTRDGHDLVDFVIDLFQGNEDKIGKPIKLEMRRDAATWLANYGWGKPVQQVSISGHDGGPVKVLDLTLLAAADLDQLEAVLARGVREAPNVEPSAGEPGATGNGPTGGDHIKDEPPIDGQFRPVDEP